MRKTAPLVALLLCATAATGADASAQQPIIRRITPDVLRPGERVTVEGRGFGTAAGTTITVNGVPASVLPSSTQTRLVVQIPDSGFACAGPTRVPVVVTVGSRSSAPFTHPLVTAAPVTLPVGAHAVRTGKSGVCLELPGGASYLVPVVNTFPHADSILTGTFRVTGPPRPAPAAAAAPMVLPGQAPVRAEPGVRAGDGREAAIAHAAILQRNRAIRAGPDRTAGNRADTAATPPPFPERIRPVTGAIWEIRFPADTDCIQFHTIGARVVSSGAHATFLEDTAAPFRGRMDVQYDSMAREYQDSILPRLKTHFGDPTVHDRALDGDGRILVVYTPRVDAEVDGLKGMVHPCNMRPRASAPASNQAEVMYVRVPGDSTEMSSSEWWWKLNATVAHEATHLASDAARRRAGHDRWEDMWLAEALGLQAEEVYRRIYTGAEWKKGAGYDLAEHELYHHHFQFLRSFYAHPDSLTPLYDSEDAPADRNGDCTPDDPNAPTVFRQDSAFSFYGSGWSLVRWATDHYARPGGEGAFLRALALETCLTGVQNLERRTGRPWAEMLVNWVLASALDDRPGFTPRDPLLTIPSWNMYDVLTEKGQRLPFPLAVTSAAPGDPADSLRIRGGGARYFEIEAPPGPPRFVELRATGSKALAEAMRVTAVRLR